ncbi:MAG: polysaccharide pyruvyl transferase family protein [Acidobacteriota bacterium]
MLNDTRVDRHFGCRAVIGSIYRLAAENGIDITLAAPAHRDWRRSETVRQAIGQADLVLVNGEGTIHHDRPAGAWLLAASEAARTLGKPAVLINAIWQDNSTQLADLAREFALISVRESASAKELRQAGLSARVVPDLALYHAPEAAPARSGVGYTDCVVSTTALALHRRMGTLGAEPISMFHDRRSVWDLLRSIRWLAGAKVAPLRRLTAVLRAALAERRGQQTHDAAFAAAVASKSLVVAGRLHMLMFCLTTRTPFLVVESNTHKNRATLTDSGLGSWRHVDVDELDHPLLARATQWEDGEADRLEAFLSDSRQRMQTLFADIAKLAS